MVYWRMTQVIAVLPPLLFIFIAIASLSYGNRTDVYNSWYGGSLSIIGSSYTVTSKASGWASDKKYLMWTDQSAVSIPKNNYTLVAALALYGYDNYYKGAMWTTFIFIFLDAGLIWLTWKPFQQFYWIKKAEKDNQTGLEYDDKGCDQYGNNKYGVNCPTEPADT